MSPFRLFARVAFFLTALSGRAAMAQVVDVCRSQDSALDACLEAAGATDLQKNACDGCIEGIYADFGSDTGNACAANNPLACSTLEDCIGLCLDVCQGEMFAKGVCEVDAERTSNGGENCEAMLCDASEVTGVPEGDVTAAPEGDATAAPEGDVDAPEGDVDAPEGYVDAGGNEDTTATAPEGSDAGDTLFAKAGGWKWMLSAATLLAAAAM